MTNATRKYLDSSPHFQNIFEQINETILKSSCFQSFLDQQFKIYYKNQQIEFAIIFLYRNALKFNNLYFEVFFQFQGLEEKERLSTSSPTLVAKNVLET